MLSILSVFILFHITFCKGIQEENSQCNVENSRRMQKLIPRVQMDEYNVPSRRMEELIPTVQRDEYNVPIINYTIFADVIDRFKCLAEVEREYIKMISECFSDPETLEEIKMTSKEFLAKGKAKPEQIDFNRCIGSVIIKEDDETNNEKHLYDCLAKYGIEEYIDKFVNRTFTRREKKLFKEFLDCLDKTNEENIEEEATDCIQSEPIMFEIAKVFKNPFPKRVYPKSLKPGVRMNSKTPKDDTISNQENSDVSDDDSNSTDEN